MRSLTSTEQRVIDLLDEALGEANFLGDISPNSSNAAELTTAIHAAQNIVLARPAYEQQAEWRKPEPEMSDEEWEAHLEDIRVKARADAGDLFFHDIKAAQQKIVEKAKAKC